jgi:membrane protein DedA with SNARE-associated domain
MIASILAYLAEWVIAVISTLGYPGIVLLMAIESACTPLPSEIILPFSGYLVYTGRFSLFWVATAGAIGCNIGSIVGYYMGMYGGRPVLLRYGKYVLISPREIEIADRWFERYGEATIFFSRLLPIIRTYISFPAGVARMNFWKFNIYTFLGSWPWCYGLAYAGYRLGEHWPDLEVYFHEFDFVIGILILAGIAGFIWLHRKRRAAERSLLPGEEPRADAAGEE